MDTKAGAFWKCLLFCAILHKTIAASAVLCPFFGHWGIVIACLLYTSYATSNRGGCHVRGYMISPEVLGLPEQLDRETVEGKAQWAKIFQDLTSVIDSMGMRCV